MSLCSSHLSTAQVTLTLQSSCAQLLTAHSSVCRVLQLLREKMEKEQKEPQALKMHCLSFVVERCAKSGINQILKLLVQRCSPLCFSALSLFPALSLSLSIPTDYSVAEKMEWQSL